jgi:hypothetical protein
MQLVVGIGKAYKRIIRRLRRGQSTTVRQERCDLSTSFMDLCNRLDRVQVVDARVKKSVMPASLTSFSSSSIAGET